MIYRMLTRGGTRGSVTGCNRVWFPGQEIEAPEGEFRHLNPRHYEKRPKVGADGPVTAPAEIKHVGGGWYEVRGQRVRGLANAERLV